MKFNKYESEDIIEYIILDDDDNFLHSYSIFITHEYGPPIGTMFDGEFIPYLITFNEDDIQSNIDRVRKLLLLI
jgi:hypothetical protein